MRRPDLNELFEIHDFEKQVLVTGKNPLDPHRCKRCGLTIRMGFGWYQARKNCSNERLNRCKKSKL